MSPSEYQRVDIEMLEYEDVMPRVGMRHQLVVQLPDAAVRDRVEEMMDLFDAFHREGLGRLVEMIRAWRGEIFLESVSRDDVTGYFLNAYDLGEAPDEREALAAAESVDAALEELRPMIESHGGMITVEEIKDGVVKVQMLGSCDGCPSSAATLTGGLEEALRRHWPNFRRLEVVEPEAEEPEAAALPEPEPVLLQIGRKPPAG
jgi:Fe-S cluster biogenesis protein NfuA